MKKMYRIVGSDSETCEMLDAMNDEDIYFETEEEAREQVEWFQVVDMMETGKAGIYYIEEQ